MSSLATLLARGVGRLMADMGYGSLTEFTLPSGRRLDLLGLAADGTLWAVEIKTSVQDFRSDRKWPDYLDYCDRFSFAVPEGFPLDRLPEECGLLIADGFQAAELRPPPHRPLHAARRKAMTLKFALCAASRLRGFTDPPPG